MDTKIDFCTFSKLVIFVWNLTAFFAVNPGPHTLNISLNKLFFIHSYHLFILEHAMQYFLCSLIKMWNLLPFKCKTSLKMSNNLWWQFFCVYIIFYYFWGHFQVKIDLCSLVLIILWSVWPIFIEVCDDWAESKQCFQCRQ